MTVFYKDIHHSCFWNSKDRMMFVQSSRLFLVLRQLSTLRLLHHTKECYARTSVAWADPLVKMGQPRQMIFLFAHCQTDLLLCDYNPSKI